MRRRFLQCTWVTTNRLPSELKPIFAPLSKPFFVIHATRDRSDLYQRINERVEKMMREGLEEEAKTV